jgi:NAD(P)-dependent dehydrogenase (short-subunit alcohol dehydrogenase family)
MARQEAGGTVAVVTGAGRGIGRETALRLAKRGHVLLATDLDADAAAETARLAGGSATSMPHDVRDPEQHRAVATRAGELGRLTVWVNNAGVLWVGNALAQPDEQVELEVRVNLLGAIHGTRAAVARMRLHGERADIVNIASLSAFPPTPGLSVYAATKAGVVSWTMSIAAELRAERSRVRLHAICPATVATAMASDHWHRSESAFQHLQTRLLQPAEVADAAVATIGTRRLVTSVAPRPDVVLLARLGGLAPRTLFPALPLVRWVGNRRRGSRHGAAGSQGPADQGPADQALG